MNKMAVVCDNYRTYLKWKADNRDLNTIHVDSTNIGLAVWDLKGIPIDGCIVLSTPAPEVRKLLESKLNRHLQVIVSFDGKVTQPTPYTKLSFDRKKEETNNMKIKFFYTNGKTYTATGVVKERKDGNEFIYVVQKNSPVKVRSEYTIDLKNLAGYIIYRSNGSIECVPIKRKFKFEVQGLGFTHEEETNG